MRFREFPDNSGCSIVGGFKNTYSANKYTEAVNLDRGKFMNAE